MHEHDADTSTIARPPRLVNPAIAHNECCRRCEGSGQSGSAVCDSCHGKGCRRQYSHARVLYQLLAGCASPEVLRARLVDLAGDLDHAEQFYRRNSLVDRADSLSKEAAVLRVVALALAESLGPPGPAGSAGSARRLGLCVQVRRAFRRLFRLTA